MAVVESIKILLVEDNPGDVRLTVEALKEGVVPSDLIVARDGEEALDYLYGRGKFKDRGWPDVILLDLNLPRLDGREVLRIVKSDGDLMHIPVIVLTTSHSEEDILKSYSLHANCYIAKPLDMNEFLDVVRLTEQFWLNVVKLPTRIGLSRL